MMIFDIIIILILLWAVYSGFRKGVIVQVGGLAGLFLGVYLAFRFGPAAGKWLGIDPKFASLAGFLIVVVGVIILLAVIGRLLRGVFSFAGLGILDKAGGVLLSVAKVGLIVAILLWGFDSVNRSEGWAEEGTLRKSRLYGPLVSVAQHAFPYVEQIKDAVTPWYARPDDNTGNGDGS